MLKKINANFYVEDDNDMHIEKFEEEYNKFYHPYITLEDVIICDDQDEEVHSRYCAYLIDWAYNHHDPAFEGCSPAGFDEWRNNENED